jgi:PKD repeat protein
VRQRIKIYEAMVAIDGDIVGLMEIENDGFDPLSAIAELVKVLNDGPCYDTTMCADMGYTGTGLGAGTYAYIDAGPGAVGTDEITVGYIYKPASVTPVGTPVVIDETAFTDPLNYGSQKNRPAIVQTFADNDGGIFTAIVNHLKSKGSSCGPGDDDPEQASCNVTRALAADYLVETVVPALQVSTGDDDVMILGDLNAYAMEDPLRALTDGGFTNLIDSFVGDYAYSYTFDGMVGTLDHSLANSSLTQQVTGVTLWHINTDEPAVIDYDEDFNPPGYYAPDPYRASDHEPVVTGISLSHVTAGFISNSPVVVGNLSVFTNTTTGGGTTSYMWNFGDGSPVVTDTNPTHLYAADGTYTVALTATDAGGSDVYTDTHVVVVQAPVAGFTSNSPVILGASAVFSNTSTGEAPLTYEWDFGDGSPVVSDTNPIHTYTSDGSYTVVLTATNPGGSDVYTDTFEVQVPTGVSLSGFSAENQTVLWPMIIALVLLFGFAGFVIQRRQLRIRA